MSRVLALLALLLLLPLIAIVSLSVWLTSKGSILFRQERIGKEGRRFSCLKFRTMIENADGVLPAILEDNPDLVWEWRCFHKLRQDPRVTTVGRWLRKGSLDELPQLWNIVRGEMAFVGPRPLLPMEASLIPRIRLKEILSVRPGLTGLAQVRGRSRLLFWQRLCYDVDYVRQRCWNLDLRLALKTLPVVISGRGAF